MRAITRFTACFLPLLAWAWAVPERASAYTLHTLMNFCEVRHCDPARPTSGLLLGDDGTLYGIAAGDVFALTPDGSGGWTYQVIAEGVAIGNSRAPLIRDAEGNLYGTGQDQVFKLVPNEAHTAWTSEVIATFCVQTNCLDGEGLLGGLSYSGSASGAPYDGTSPLYGTAARGGAHGDRNIGGIVYSLTPGGGDTWTKTTLYDFCALSNCADGVTPLGGVVPDGSGNLLGTTANGGIKFHGTTGGTVFKLSQTGGNWSVSVLHNFCSKRGQGDCLDGATPIAGVTLDAAGDILGNTEHGGRNHGGTAFRMKPSGEDYAFHTIYDFAGSANPLSPMTLGSSGELLGTTWKDGGLGAGTVYSLSFHNGEWTQQTLYTFCTLKKCKDGNNPSSSTPLLDNAGNLFGTAYAGGAHNGGTLFELTP